MFYCIIGSQYTYMHTDVSVSVQVTVASLICLGPSFQKMTHHILLHGSLPRTDLEKIRSPALQQDLVIVIARFHSADSFIFVDFQLFARITKLGWFDVIKDEYVFKNVVNDVGQFIQVCLLFSAHPAISHCSQLLLKIKSGFKYKWLKEQSRWFKNYIFAKKFILISFWIFKYCFYYSFTL